MRRGRRYAVGLAVAAGMLATAGPGQAVENQWFPPQSIGGPYTADARPAVNHSGGAFVLFGRFDEMAAAQRPAGGDFAPAVLVPWLHSSHLGFHTALPMYDSWGRLVITWGDTETGGFRYAVRDPATGEGRIDTLVEGDRNPEAIGAALAADRHGTVYVAWREYREQDGMCCYGFNGPFVATMEDGQRFGPAHQISPTSATDGRIALDASPSGAAALVWPGVNPTGPNAFMTSVQPVDGSFGPPEEIPGVTAGPEAGIPRVSIDDAGTALIAIRSTEYRGVSEPPGTRVVLNVRHPDGTFSEPETVSTTDEASDPAIAAGPSGEAVLAWTEGEWENARLLVSVRNPDGSFSEPVTLAPDGLRRIEPEIGMDAAGNAIVAWAARGSEGWRIYAAHRPPMGSFGPPQAISGPRVVPDDGGTFPRLAVGGPGNAVVTWDAFPEGGDAHIDAAVFDSVPPQIPSFGVVTGADPVAEPGAAAARSRRVRRGRITFRWFVSEQSQVAIELRRRGSTVRTVTVDATPGANLLKVRKRGLSTGRYQAVLRATDRLGHESAPRRARFRLLAR